MTDTPYERVAAFLAAWDSFMPGATILAEGPQPDDPQLTKPDLYAVLAGDGSHPFGTWLTAAMEERDLGIGDVADLTHYQLSAGQILGFRSGRYVPTVNQTFSLASAIGAPLLDALGAAGHGHIVVAIIEENDQAKAAGAPAIGGA